MTARNFSSFMYFFCIFNGENKLYLHTYLLTYLRTYLLTSKQNLRLMKKNAKGIQNNGI